MQCKFTTQPLQANQACPDCMPVPTENLKLFPSNTQPLKIKPAHAPDMRDTMAPSLASVKAPRARVTDSTVGMAAGEQGATVRSAQMWSREYTGPGKEAECVVQCQRLHS